MGRQGLEMRLFRIAWFRLALILLACSGGRGFAVSCKVTAPHAPSEAETAFLRGDYDKAAGLYQAQWKSNPNDAGAVAGLVGVLLRQQKVAEASQTAEQALTAMPSSVVVMTAQAEVLYRQGTPWLAGGVTEKAMKIDPCNARLHLMRSRLARLNSLYASEQTEVRAAHSLDPTDPAIRSAWIRTLPAGQRIAELEAYLASPTGDDPDDIRRLKMYLEALKKSAAEPHKSCRLASSATSTEIPFIMLMRDATHVRAFGLEVKLNDHKARLQIDTGASGLLISRPVAEHAGLKPFSETEVGGIGSGGMKGGYIAYADSIQVGGLEFHDCVVRVLDSRNVVDSDGLIGMDVFSRFLVTLDYPMQKLELGPLPPRPTDTVPETPTLETKEGSGEGSAEEASNSAPASGNKDEATPAPAPRRGPQDRYIAPEMKDYTWVYRVGHQLLMPTTINQSATKRLFILDTGSWTTTISPEAARAVTKVHSDDTMRVHGISGNVEKVYTADDVTFEFANIRQPGREVASFDTSNISRNTGLEISGFIGATTLGQLKTHIDYRDGLVKFEYDPNHYRRILPPS
jgi:predicted aspartyl protease